MIQVFIFILGGAAVLMVNIPATRRLAPLFGVASQPFWIYDTFVHAQWGMFGLSVVYTFGWLIGVYHEWIKVR